MNLSPPPTNDEAIFDTYEQQFGSTFIDYRGDPCRVEVIFSDCDDDQCDRCYEPLLLTIGVGGEPGLQLDLDSGWGEVDKLISALTAARQRHR